MVAISLYRGNLHRVPDVPRRWLMPNRSISLKDFRGLLHRRSLSLSHSLPPPAASAEDKSIPNPSFLPVSANCAGPSRQSENPAASDCKEGTSKAIEESKDAVEDHKPAGVVAEPKKESSAADHGAVTKVPATEEPVNRDDEPTDKADAPNDKDKRKKEVEGELKVLNAKKHNLVQVLKQILNAEEELKRRNSVQTRPSVPLQVDVTNDSGSMIRHPTPRPGPDGNQVADAEGGGEAEGSLNNQIHPRPLLRMSSTSPSPESWRRPALSQLNLVPHSARAGLVVSGSPSRFAPPTHLPGVSLSGTNYVASSLSPAASGGTSAFKDARQPSPWN